MEVHLGTVFSVGVCHDVAYTPASKDRNRGVGSCYQATAEEVNSKLRSLNACFTKTKTNSMALSPQANYTDWATATCRRNLVPTFVDRGVSCGQRGGSLTVVNFSFLDRCVLYRFVKRVDPWNCWTQLQLRSVKPNPYSVYSDSTVWLWASRLDKYRIPNW
jgi:hypothetical protein